MPADPSRPFATTPAPRDQVAAAPRRVLIADDEPMVRRVLVRWFTLHGWVVCEAANGVDAVHALQPGQPFDLVLCDHKMPLLGGPEIFTWVAANRPALAPVVVIMSGALQEDLETFARSAACRLLAKPFDLSALSQMVHEVVSGVHAR